LNLGISLEKRANDFRQNVITLAKHDVQAVDQYNSLLADYKDYVSRVGYQMAQMNSSYSNQQRINNSLALYNAQDAQGPCRRASAQGPCLTRHRLRNKVGRLDLAYPSLSLSTRTASF
jgi:hypothetical protein